MTKPITPEEMVRLARYLREELLADQGPTWTDAEIDIIIKANGGVDECIRRMGPWKDAIEADHSFANQKVIPMDCALNRKVIIPPIQ